MSVKGLALRRVTLIAGFLLCASGCRSGPERAVSKALEAIHAKDDLAFTEVVDTGAFTSQVTRDLYRLRGAWAEYAMSGSAEQLSYQQNLSQSLIAFVRRDSAAKWSVLRSLSAIDSACKPRISLRQQSDRAARVELRCRSVLYGAELRFPLLLRRDVQGRWRIVGVDPLEDVFAQQDSLEHVRVAQLAAAIRDSIARMVNVESSVWVDTAVGYYGPGRPSYTVKSHIVVRNRGDVPLLGVRVELDRTIEDTLSHSLSGPDERESIARDAVDTLTGGRWPINGYVRVNLSPDFLARLKLRTAHVTFVSYRLPGDTTLRMLELPADYRLSRGM